MKHKIWVGNEDGKLEEVGAMRIYEGMKTKQYSLLMETEDMWRIRIDGVAMCPMPRDEAQKLYDDLTYWQGTALSVGRSSRQALQRIMDTADRQLWDLGEEAE